MPATDRCQPRPCPCSYGQIRQIRHAGCMGSRPERRTMLQVLIEAPCPHTAHTAWSRHEHNQQSCMCAWHVSPLLPTSSSRARIHSQISKRMCACAARAVRQAASRARGGGKLRPVAEAAAEVAHVSKMILGRWLHTMPLLGQKQVLLDGKAKAGKREVPGEPKTHTQGRLAGGALAKSSQHRKAEAPVW